MKTTILKILALTVGLGITISSCKKDNASDTVSNTEAANAIGDMLSTDFNGCMTEAGFVAGAEAGLAGGRIGIGEKSLASSCNVTADTTFLHSSISSAPISFSGISTFTYNLNCDGFVPTSLHLAFTGRSKRNGIMVTADGANDAVFEVAGFDITESNYIINGTFKRAESIKQLTGIRSYTSSHEVIVTNVLIDKITKEIKGGNATYTMIGVTGKGTVFTHTGTIIFLGSGTATVTVNGSTYFANLLSGTVTPS